MKQLKLITISFGIIILTTLILDISLGKLLDRIFVDKTISKFQYIMNDEEDVDWLIVGSSRASHHYDTPFISDSLKISAENLGEDGRGLTYYCAAVKSYLENHRPKIIILDLLAEDLSGSLNNRIKSLYPYIDTYKGIESVAMDVDSDNKILLKSHLLRYNSEIFQFVKKMLNPFDNKDLGFEPLKFKSNNRMIEDTILSARPVNTVARNALVEIDSLCKSNNVKLIVAYSPEYAYREYELPTTLLCDSLGIEIIDASDFRLPLPTNAYFNDNFHLNEFGAREFTKYFIDKVSNL